MLLLTTSTITILQIIAILTEAVSLGQLDKLTREQLLDLDREVSKYYNESYTELDGRDNPTNYDEQLFRSLRSVRHTIVLNIFDFKYTRNVTKWNSMGSKVDSKLCKQQLRLLAQMANKTQILDHIEQVPLSIVDFFDSSAKTGSGVLNGNFVWLGSYNSCLRSKIPAHLWRRYLGIETNDAEYRQVSDINGRYCVAHLRAKSWPKWDNYFEDRLTIKRGVCLPETCHTALYDLDEETKQLVDYLARINLVPPFDGDRYEASGLYCLPDEDSPFRQMDLGSQLFIVFAVFWVLLTIYTNVKYYKRVNAMQKLRETVDIKMIINEKLDDLASDYRDDEKQRRDKTEMRPPLSKPAKAKTTNMNQLELSGGAKNLGFDLVSDGDQSGLSSAVSSAVTTPIPSGIDESDSDNVSRLLEPFARKRKRKRSNKTNVNYNYANGNTGQGGETGGGSSANDSIDLIRAFSFEANLNFLFKPRLNEGQEAPKREQQHLSTFKKRGSQQLATVARRTSSLNEALVKDLHKYKDSPGTSNEQASTVKIISAGQQQQEQSSSDEKKKKLLVRQDKSHESHTERPFNIDVLDGMKVIATSWIVWGHTMMFFFGLVVDMRFGTERMFDLTMLTTINTLQVVGLFYIITGCLLTYFSFNKAKPKQLQNPVFWLLVLIGRYIRLIPAYALVFWFARHVAPLTGSGPGFYDYRTDDEHPRTACANESWSVMWTMSAADIKIPMDCVPQAWYLSDDFRTLLVLPIYVLLLSRSTLLGYSAIFGTFVYSNFRLTQILREAKIDYKILLNWHPHVYALMADRLHEVYTNSAVRMSTYLLGVIVGHLLYMYETRYVKQWPNWFRKWGMKVALVWAGCFFLGAPILASPIVNQFLPAKENIDSDVVVWLIPVFKSAMEIAIAVMILLLVTGGGFTFIRRILGSQAMKILSNISYAVFLTHVEIMYKLPAHQVDSDYWHLFKHAVFFIIVAHVISFFLHLFFEMPVHNVTRHIFKRAFKVIS